MEAGIVGLPYIGKTTLFNALTALGVSGDAGATKPNVGVVSVPDPRLNTINQFIETKKIIPATLQVIDVAGLVAGASKGEGMGNRFLSHIRNVDAILHVVRCFDDPNVPHVNDTIDPVRDVDEVETELIFADMEVVENAMHSAEKKARTGEKEAKKRLELLKRCMEALEQGNPVSSVKFDEDEYKALKSFAFLSSKPVLYVANIGEDDLDKENEHVAKLRAYAEERDGLVVSVCAKLDAELAELDEDEKAEMLEGLGLAEPALAALARAAYKLLGLQSFFTAGPKEIRAWTIPINAPAPEAAGVIHSDIQRGFIRVEVYSVSDLEEHKSEQAIKAAGKLRVEGKNYTINEGDVCHYLFNV